MAAKGATRAVIGSAPGVGVPAKVAATPAVGFPLVNGTPTILSWTAPNDGNIHIAVLSVAVNVATLEVGGQITVNSTFGGTGYGSNVLPGGQSVGTHVASIQVPMDPGSTVTVTQSSALTSGAASIFALILGT